MERIKVKVGWSGKNFSAIIEDVGGIVIATHKTLKGIKKEMESAFDFHIEGLVDDGDTVPEYILKRDYEFEYKLLASALLKTLDGIVTRSALARVTKINERQLGHYFQGKKEAREATRVKIIDGVKTLGNDLLSVV